ncbi:AEC family transporter [Bacillus infantis]|nr:AEC family transporter [Bacillus infantis]
MEADEMSFITILIPIFLIFGLGYAGQKIFRLETKSLSIVAIYLMTPFLAFRTFYETEFNLDYAVMAIYTIGLALAIIAIVYAAAYFAGYSRKRTCAIILSSAFMNNGNYGTPLVLFAFGQEGIKYAIVLMVIQQLLMCTLGVYYAAKGSIENASFKTALKEVVRVPIVYGALLGAALQFMNIPVSGTLMEAVRMVGDAAIPTVMIILGITLANISVKNLEIGPLSVSLTLRMVVSPLIALALTFFLPADTLLKQIMIVMAAMPSAANTTMYAVQYGTDPELVSSATLASTCLSLITLPIILYSVTFMQ